MASLKQRLVAWEEGAAAASSTASKAPRRATPPSDAQGALSIKERLSAYQKGAASASEEAPPQDATPQAVKESKGWSTLKSRMKTYEFQQLKEPDATGGDGPKTRPRMSSALQERLAMLKEASSASSSKSKMEEELNSLRGSLAKYKGGFEEAAKQEGEGTNTSYQTRKVGGSSLIQQRMAMLREMNNEQPLDGASPDVRRGRDMKEFHQRMLAFREAIESKKEAGQDPEMSPRRASTQGSDFQQRLSKFAAASSTGTFQPPAFADASATGAFKRKKMLAEEIKDISLAEDSQEVRVDSSRTVGSGDLEERMKKYQDASAPAESTKKTEREHSNSLKDRAAQLEETLLAEEEFVSHPEISITGGSLQERMKAFEGASSPGSAKNDNQSIEGKEAANDDLQEEEVHAEGDDKVPDEAEANSNKVEGEGSAEVENSTGADDAQEDATEEDEYLFDLAVNYNLLQLQQQNTPRNIPRKTSSPIDEEKGDIQEEKSSIDDSPDEGAGTEDSHDGVPTEKSDSPSTGSTPVGDEIATDNGEPDLEDVSDVAPANETSDEEHIDWLNEEWISQHLVRDDKYNSLEFRLKDRTLADRLGKLSERTKGDLINTFVKLLLLHANEATQLDLSGCLLPDEFFLSFAEEILKNPAGSFPKLQLLNLTIEGPGIEAISEVIAHKSAWKYLQILLIENPDVTSEAEEALTQAVGRNTSPIVVCSASIRDPSRQVEIGQAMEYNQFLLFCATGSLFGVEVDSLDVFTKVEAEVEGTKEP
ncbi:hypothetical protein ACHAXT_008602 [Thalassiosira profunda]